VADGRSPIARNWIEHFVARGDEVHLVSTFPCEAGSLRLAGLHVLPVAFARFAGGNVGRGAAPASAGRAAALTRNLRARAVAAAFPTVFGWLAPATLGSHARRLRELVLQIRPEVVHALRIPYEGIVAAEALAGTAYPLVVSVWGNDLELWAERYPLVGRFTRRALARATALHPDCARDLHLAEQWGWNPERPSAVLPGNGGIRRDVFHPGPPDAEVARRHALPAGGPLVLNARGFRAYVRNDTFFRSIPRVLERRPEAVFAAVGMQGDPRAERWIRDLGIGHAVRLLPRVAPAEMAALLRLSTAAVSPSEFDGTPNTLLEAMACGAFPVAGDIASVREWITDGQNGLLCDPADPAALAAALLRALGDEPLRRGAAERNAALVAERADFAEVMRRAEAFYARVVNEALPG
jgi:glycosyltransferase involved in cell wall biosynthesis